MDFANMDRRQMTIVASGFSVMLTLHFTFQLLSQHLFYWKNPKQQKAIVIIILLAPVYAVDSFVGLLDLRGSKPSFLLLDSVRECYEALAIAKFLDLMHSYLDISMSKNAIPDEMKGKEIHFSFRMTLLQPGETHLNYRTLKFLKQCTWQFVIIRPICSVLMITLQVLGIYPSWISWMFTIILALSIFTALYSLVVFYLVFSKELEPHKPLAKFICIKGIVFFCFWQGVLLEILAALGIHFRLPTDHSERAIQNALVCVEMVIFSVLQQYAFHVAPYSGDLESKLKLRKRD